MPEPQVTIVVVPRERFSHTERNLADIYEHTAFLFKLTYVSAEACRLLSRRAILVTQHQEQLPKELPDSVRWFCYLPFDKVMASVGAVIHHGGRGTLSCAIAAGVPQLVLAMGADLPDNAARLKRLGVADYLLPPEWQASTVAEKLHELTRSEAVALRCRELSARVSGTDPLASACEIIEDAIA